MGGGHGRRRTPAIRGGRATDYRVAQLHGPRSAAPGPVRGRLQLAVPDDQQQPLYRYGLSRLPLTAQAAAASSTRSRTTAGITRVVFFSYSQKPGMIAACCAKRRSRSGPAATGVAWTRNF